MNARRHVYCKWQQMTKMCQFCCMENSEQHS
jgi:hypothetical protein